MVRSRPYKRPYRRTSLVSAAANKAVRAVMNKRAGGFLGIEKKFTDTILSSVLLASDWSSSSAVMHPTPLNGLTRGNGESNREGREVTMVSCYVGGHIVTAAEEERIFLALVMDTQTNGGTFTPQDLFEPGVAGTTPLRNLQHVKRFKVLDTWQATMVSTSYYNGTTAAVGLNTKHFRLKWKGNVKAHYDGNAGDASDITDNSLWVVGIRQGSAASGSVTWNARLRYYG